MSVVEIKRRKGESFESLLRRFTRRVQVSGKLLEAKKNRYYTKTPNQTKKKASALRRLELRTKRDYLLKVGKLVEERPRRGARR